MKPWLFMLLLLVACKAPSSPREATSDAGRPSASPSAPIALASTAPPETVATVQSLDDRARDIVRRWNEAHATRDAKALGTIYAERFMHYGTPMTREQGVKAKEAAFAAAPDFTQKIGAIEVEPALGKDQRLARFIKTVTQKGQSKDYPAALKIVDDHVIEENDDIDWCLSGELLPTDRKIPPFTMSAGEAMRAAMESKHVKKQREQRASIMIDMKGFACARACAKPEGECGFQMHTSDIDATTTSNLVEWLRVDPRTKRLLWEEGGRWVSEPLPDVPSLPYVAK